MAALYPQPPPTSNTLDPLQRSRLLKSTRKLGALLGATPRVLEPAPPRPPPLTPATRAFRREGKVFYSHSASSSSTSLCTDDGCDWTPSSPGKQHRKIASTPIAIELPLTNSEIRSFHKKSKSSHNSTSATSQQLSQPLLYRLRPQTAPSPIASHPTSVSGLNSGPHMALLTPLSPTFGNIDKLSKSSSRKEQTDSDRRRKMAKLARTLGENIPPELVFGPPPRTSSLAPSSTAGKRKRSATGAHRSRPPPPLPNAPVPQGPIVKSVTKAPALPSKSRPSPIVTVTTTTATTATPRKRGHRPRSLTLTHIPMPLHKDIVIEQEVVHPRAQSRSLDEPHPVVSTDAMDIVDYGRRKEKEWSGEWNMKDMDEVMNALRELRVR